MEGVLRLIAFGDSNTYGHSLPDKPSVYDPLTKLYTAADEPSDLAFPKLIANHFDIPVINLSSPGGSNRLIWYNIINFDFQPDDIVICTWTYSNRSCLIMPDRIENLGVWPSMVPAVKNYAKFIASSNSKLDLETSSYLYMDHSLKYLKNKVKKVQNYKVHRPDYKKIPPWCEIDFICALGDIVSLEEKDFALDGKHYGVKSHEKFAKRMIQDLTIDSN